MLEINHEGQLSEKQRQYLLSTYDKNDFFCDKKSRLKFWINPNMGAVGEIDFIKGWEILDLGCGSKISSSVDGYDQSEYEAWFPRVCSLYGAKKVVGIDLYEQDPKDKSLYTHISANLLNLLSGDNLVKKLSPQKFDLINMCGVCVPGSPGNTFAETLGLGMSAICLGMLPSNYTENVNALINNLKKQSVEILKPGGILALDVDIYKLNDSGILVNR